MKAELKDTIQFIASVIILLSTVVLTYIAHVTPPEGVIDGSELAVIGEFLTFVAACWGITEFAKIQGRKYASGKGEKNETPSE